VGPRGWDPPTLGRGQPSPQKRPKKRGVQKKGPNKRVPKKGTQKGSSKKGTQKGSSKKGTQKEGSKKNAKAFSNFGFAFACPPNGSVEGSRRLKRRTWNAFITTSQEKGTQQKTFGSGNYIV